MKSIYLDNNATTQPAPEVISEIKLNLSVCYGNPSSLHHAGISALRAITNARNNIAQRIGVNPQEIIFTSGGTESNNLALHGAAVANQRVGKHIITTPVEHKSVLASLKQLEKEGFKIDFADVDQFGSVNQDSVCQLMTNETALVAIMHVNNELGTINPINEIANKVKAINPATLVFADGVQATGKLVLNLSQIDLYSMSAHKFHGLKGIGALVVKKGTKLAPLIFGGNQENTLRAGTENVPGIISFAKALELCYQNFQKNTDHITSLKQNLLNQLNKIENITINSPSDSVTNTINISILGVSAEIMLHALNEKGIYISAGSACASNQRKPSHVLEAVNLSRQRIESAIRISLSRYNSIEEINKVGMTIQEITAELRSIIVEPR